jgi:hypothetical protein
LDLPREDALICTLVINNINTNSSDDKSGDAALRIIDQRMAELRYEVSGKNTFENEKYHVDIMMKGLVNTFNDLHDSGSQMFKDCLYLRVLTEVKTQLVAKNAPD